MSYKPRHAKPSATKRRAAAFAAAAGVFASLAVNPTTAEAAPAPQQPVGGSSIAQLSSNSGLDVFLKSANTQLENLGSSTDQAVRDAAWNLRNSLRAQADGLAAINPDLPAQAKASIDQTVERLFPGLIAERTPKPKPKPKPKPQPAPAPAQAPAQQQRPAFDYGPCPKDAKACVDKKDRTQCTGASKGFGTRTTGADGLTPMFKAKKGEAFYVVEVEAPSKFIRSDEITTVTVTDQAGQVFKSGIKNVPTKDSGKWFDLPKTGAIGVGIFALAGAGLVAGGALTHLRSRKRNA